jgi:hypothetical protein
VEWSLGAFVGSWHLSELGELDILKFINQFVEADVSRNRELLE